MTPEDLMAFLNAAVSKMMKPSSDKRQQRNVVKQFLKSKKIQKKLTAKRLELQKEESKPD